MSVDCEGHKETVYDAIHITEIMLSMLYASIVSKHLEEIAMDIKAHTYNSPHFLVAIEIVSEMIIPVSRICIDTGVHNSEYFWRQKLYSLFLLIFNERVVD